MMTGLAGVRAAAHDAISQAGVPGVSIAVAHADEKPQLWALGADGAGRPIAEDSLFPVASITKLATALAVLRLCDAGEMTIDDALARHAPEAVAAQPGVTLRRLLNHTSGLPDDLAPESASYTADLDWAALSQACLGSPIVQPTGRSVMYSNVGYGLLALVVERAIGKAFQDALASLVFEPLRIEAYLGVEPPREPIHLADVHSSHVGTELEPFNSALWRSLALPWGGLLTTSSGALVLARAFAGVPGDFLRPDTRSEATRNQTPGLSGGIGGPMMWADCPWGLGAELRGKKDPHGAPGEASAGSFGHMGASGCIAWCDPEAEVSWAILGSRTINNGWLLSSAPTIGAAILSEYRAS